LDLCTRYFGVINWDCINRNRPLVGLIIANRISKKEDPNDVLARIYETPDLDKMMDTGKPPHDETSTEEEENSVKT